MNRLLGAFAVCVFGALATMEAGAVQPDEILSDPVLEERARDISQNLRCLVCQNQSIDDSDADLARDLRLIVRQRLVAGDSDDAVIQYIVDRYGDYVLLGPPFKGTTYFLWLGPIAILLAAGGGIFLAARRRKSGAALEKLTEAEQQRLSELLGPGQGKP